MFARLKVKKHELNLFKLKKLKKHRKILKVPIDNLLFFLKFKKSAGISKQN